MRKFSLWPGLVAVLPSGIFYGLPYLLVAPKYSHRRGCAHNFGFEIPTKQPFGSF